MLTYDNILGSTPVSTSIVLLAILLLSVWIQKENAHRYFSAPLGSA